MLQKKLQFHRVCSSSEELFPVDTAIVSMDIQDNRICFAKYQQGIYAFAYKCPHASGRMDEGFIDAIGNVVCPVHRYRFSLRNGRDSMGEGYTLKVYPVEVRADGVYVGISSPWL